MEKIEPKITPPPSIQYTLIKKNYIKIMNMVVTETSRSNNWCQSRMTNGSQ